jgi:hypothetical protein
MSWYVREMCTSFNRFTKPISVLYTATFLNTSCVGKALAFFMVIRRGKVRGVPALQNYNLQGIWQEQLRI